MEFVTPMIVWETSTMMEKSTQATFCSLLPSLAAQATALEALMETTGFLALTS
jgi:hypothetical protein